MKAVFIELPAFERLRAAYLDDDGFAALQELLMKRPDAGAQIRGTGGLRKLRFRDRRRHKGTRGGIRLIYYWWDEGAEFWLFTLYDKNEASDLTAEQRTVLKTWVKAELAAKRPK